MIYPKLFLVWCLRGSKAQSTLPCMCWVVTHLLICMQGMVILTNVIFQKLSLHYHDQYVAIFIIHAITRGFKESDSRLQHPDPPPAASVSDCVWNLQHRVVWMMLEWFHCCIYSWQWCIKHSLGYRLHQCRRGRLLLKAVWNLNKSATFKVSVWGETWMNESLHHDRPSKE